MCSPLCNKKSEALEAKRQMAESHQLGSIANSSATTSTKEEKASKNGLNTVIEKKERKQFYLNKRVKQNLRLGSERSIRCGRFTIGKEAHVVFNPTHNSASYMGIETCESVWECPCCRAKIMNRRAGELSEFVDYYGQSATAMLTLTVRHNRRNTLSKLLGNSAKKEGLKGSLNRLLAHRDWRNICDKYNVAGHVRGIEVTNGVKNGFHPHYHIALFFGTSTSRTLSCTIGKHQFKPIKLSTTPILDVFFDSNTIEGLPQKMQSDPNSFKNIGKYWSSIDTYEPFQFFDKQLNQNIIYSTKIPASYNYTVVLGLNTPFIHHYSKKNEDYLQDLLLLAKQQQLVDDLLNEKITFMEQINLNNALIAKRLEDEIYRLWLLVTEQSGLEKPSREHGVKVTNGTAEYLAKWSLSSELSALSKKASNDNFSIVQIESMLSELYLSRKSHTKKQSVEYIRLQGILGDYYKTMKGTRMLEWSRKLKKSVDIDITLSNNLKKEVPEEDESLIVASIPSSMFMKVYWYGCYEALLSTVEKDPKFGTFLYMYKLKERTRNKSQFDLSRITRRNLKMTDVVFEFG